MQVAQHDAPIKKVGWVDALGTGILATGSWDKTIKVGYLQIHLIATSLMPSCPKYWDLRSANPVATVDLLERCYTFDIQYPFIVVGTAEGHIQIFNITDPTTAYKVCILKFSALTCLIAGRRNLRPCGVRHVRSRA